MKDLGDDLNPSSKRVFITSASYNGAMGGLLSADALCQAAAAAIPLGGRWTAWLSTASTDALGRVNGEGPWYLVDRKTKVFSNRASLMTAPLHAIDQTEAGTTLGTGSSWTGSETGGIVSKDGYTCSGWLSKTGLGLFGFFSGSSDVTDWTNSYTDVCTNARHLYCFEE